MIIDPKMRESILSKLKGIERDHNVRILYACESGSRAWGFESTDSDYDVRFIYSRPRDWYLSIDVERKRDVIEIPVDKIYDINGWDLRKALGLLLKTNPPLNEWIVSPIVYLEHGWFADRLRDLAPSYYDKTSAGYHYRQMAKRTYYENLRGDTVVRKKYLYVLRPLLSIRWLESNDGLVPIRFAELVEETVRDSRLNEEITELLRLKRLGNETDRGAPFPAIQAFAETELARHEEGFSAFEKANFDKERLNDLFRAVITELSPETDPV